MDQYVDLSRVPTASYDAILTAKVEKTGLEKFDSDEKSDFRETALSEKFRFHYEMSSILSAFGMTSYEQCPAEVDRFGARPTKKNS